MRKSILSVIIISSALASGGCAGLFESACSTAMPALNTAATYGDDAEAALNRVQLVFDSLDLPADVRAKVTIAMSKAWDALRAAQHALLAAIDKCSQPDLLVVFADFVRTWKDIEHLLSTNSRLLEGSGQNAFSPAIVLRARAAQ